jgi:DNA-binding GntR family transcriptional regulator
VVSARSDPAAVDHAREHDRDHEHDAVEQGLDVILGTEQLEPGHAGGEEVDGDAGADRFGLSRPAVRTALIRLEHDGLVVREPNRGARVRLVTESGAVEILETRAALESLAARHTAARASSAQVAELEAITAEMAAMHEAGDLIAMSACNARLHRRIIEISAQGAVTRLIALLGPQLVRFQYRTILQPGRPDLSLKEHGEIVAAIAAHDQDSAEHAMRAHLINVARAMRDLASPDIGADRARSIAR